MIVYELLVKKKIKKSNDLQGSYDLLLKDDSFEKDLIDWAKLYRGIKTDRGFICNHDGTAQTFDIKFSFQTPMNRNLFFQLLEDKNLDVEIQKTQYSV